MTEILTESFCERCGTRYTFESNARRRGFQRVRLLTLGFKHFVENDGSTVKEAMEAARGDVTRSASTEQIDAFHRTFSFCMGCRQYTCTNCWNEAEGMCLTCAPDLSREVLPAPFPDLPLHPVAGPESAAAVTPGAAAATAEWPLVEPIPTAAGVVHGTEASVPGAEAAGQVARAEDDDGAPAVEAEGAAEGDEAPVVEAAGAADEAPVVEPPAVTAGPAAEAPPAVLMEAPPLAQAVALAPLAPGTGETLEAPAEAEVVAASAAEQVTEGTVKEPAAIPAEIAAVAAGTAQPSAQPAGTSAGQPDALTPAELALVAGALAARSAAARGADEGRAGQPVAGLGEPRDHAAVGKAQTRAMLGRFRPGRPASAPPAGVGAPPVPPGAPAAPAPGPVVALPSQPSAAATPAAPPSAAPASAPPPTPAAHTPAPPAPPPAAPAREDLVIQPTWSVVAPDAPAAPATGPAPVVPPPGSRAPAGPPAPIDPLATRSPRPLAPRPAPARPPAGAVSPWAARLASARPETGVWAESSRDVLGEPGSGAGAGIQACVSCGLPLSATARFCRRCGSRQG
ncbi:MAG: hypothetical protein H6Q36_558 [Chloroflexi bacterium]|nr:hypothetical protein [Chloroflexota bacterium]